MFRSVYFHIGPHKTGSSYLQSFLINNKERLMEKDYVFPDLSNLNGEGHHIIAEPKFIKNEFHSFIDELNKNPINNNKILILSSENFSRLNQDEITIVKNALKDIPDIIVLMFLRNPASVLRSLWCESIKHKSTKSHPDFLVEHFVKPHFSEILNPYILHDKFSNEFKVRVIDYDKICKKNISSIAKIFLEAISCDGKFKYPTFEINKSFSLEETEIYRNVNIAYKKNNLPTLNQKEFKKVAKINSLQVSIDDASSRILRIPFEDSALSGPYKRFINDSNIEYYNPIKIGLFKDDVSLSNLEIMQSYDELISVKFDDN